MIEQRSERWHQQRIGRFTGSEIYKLMTEPKSKKESLSVGAKTYIFEKVVQQITGYRKKVFGEALDWGIENEPIGIDYYEQQTFNTVDEVGFLKFGTDAGASPDGLIGEDGVLELKCPFNPEVHFKNLLLKDVAEFKKTHKNYYWQIQMELLSSGREWCDFASFGAHDFIPDGLKMKILRIDRNEDDIALLKTKIDLAIEEKNRIISELENIE